MDRWEELDNLDSVRSLSADLCGGALTYVAWLLVLDLRLTLDLSSLSDCDRETPDPLDRGRNRPSSSLSSRVLRLSARSVSGGVGGRALFFDDEDVLVSSPLSPLSVSPSAPSTSVGSGVKGSDRFWVGLDTSSRLKASLLCALLKDG